jgi:predicted small secreted protein
LNLKTKQTNQEINMTFAIRTLLLAFLLGAGLTGCNTMEGVGQDMEEAGEAIEREASEA